MIGFVVFMVLFFTIRSKYFERSDFLRPVSRTIKNAAGRISTSWHQHESNTVEDIMDGVGEDENQNTNELTDASTLSNLAPWEKWMAENPHLQSVGDIFDKCGR